jgi:serine/threonine protein kinase
VYDVMNDSLEKPSDTASPAQKDIVYKDPKVKIGAGKFGPVDLIIYNDELYALKRIPKSAIDKPKRIQHIKQEKNVLLMLKQLQEDIKNGTYTSNNDYRINTNFDDVFTNKDA